MRTLMLLCALALGLLVVGCAQRVVVRDQGRYTVTHQNDLSIGSGNTASPAVDQPEKPSVGVDQASPPGMVIGRVLPEASKEE